MSIRGGSEILNKLAILVLTIIVVAQSCGSEGDYIRSTSFKGIKGEIIRVDFYCYSGCMGVGQTGDESNPDSSAWIEAYRNGEIAGKAYTDDKGKFELPLPQGIYDLRIYPPQSSIDEELVGIWLTGEGGISFRRSYHTNHQAWTIYVTFHADVDEERIQEILNENNLKSLEVYDFDKTISHRVEIPHDAHVQDVVELLEQNYVEVESANLDYDIGSCAA
jgi:hypothetical protein